MEGDRGRQPGFPSFNVPGGDPAAWPSVRPLNFAARRQVSHFIVAVYPGGSTRLGNQMSILTLSSLRRSGFDVYEVYDATGCHGGISGNGNSKAVDEALARKAYARALGWAAALREAWPMEVGSAGPGLSDLCAAAPLNDPSLQADAIGEYLDVERRLACWSSDKDGRERACGLVEDVVAFAESVYTESLRGPVEIRFL